MTAPGFFDSLERQLGDGFDRTVARRATRRRLMERAGGVGIGLVAVFATAFFALTNESASAGVSVQERGGLVYVRLTDLEHRAGVIEHAAAAAGIDLTVTEVPVGPALVGRFVSYEFAGERTGELKELDRDGPAFSGFVIPAGFDGTLVLEVGRPADGEPYALTGNAASAGEPLECSDIVGASPATALDIADDRDVDARWIVLTDGGQRPVDPTELRDDEFAALRVDRALSIDGSTVAVFLTDGITPLPPLELTAPAAC